MNKAFLRQVVDHYMCNGGLSDKILIFPNRRSIIFCKKYIEDYLLEKARETGSKPAPMLAPETMAVNDFFAGLSGQKVADRVSLLLTLYDCYRDLNKKAESLDDFVYWGDVLISDFNDIDKYMVDVKGLFTNIHDLKDIKDDFSDLTPNQVEAIRKLANHFSTERWRPGRLPEDKDIKGRFLQLWQILFPLYNSFRDRLSRSGLAYEGMVYRQLTDRLKDEFAADLLRQLSPNAKSCVFIGLNALNECEKSVLKRFKTEGLAEFCWDFSSPMLQDSENPSSFFMKDNIALFPPAFTPDTEGCGRPRIHVVSVPSSTGQARLLPDIIKSVPAGERQLDFAVVLPDESMLLPVLSSIPDSVKDVNVTMGYPLQTSDWNSMMRSVALMQLQMRPDGTIYHRYLHEVLSNGIFKSVLSTEENELVAKIKKASKSYVPYKDLVSSELFGFVFRPVINDNRSSEAGQISKFAEFLSEVSFAVASRLDKENDTLQLECAYRYYTCVKRLSSIELNIMPKTFIHLLDQLITGVSVPFAGEPLGGLQVMGPLETRALDFRRMVIMNANESVFPRKSVDSSFIPPELRRAFGLPTYEYQDAVWAYYFYRMIARCEDVWMIYDTRTDGKNSGEESRYIKQLRIMYRDYCDVDESVAESSVSSYKNSDCIVKTAEDVVRINESTLSASVLQKYITCPVQFYYYCVKGLRKTNEVKDNIDSGLLGDVCHNTLMSLYCGEKEMRSSAPFDKRNRKRTLDKPITITRAYLESWLDRREDIKRKVLVYIKQSIKSPEVGGRDLVSAEIAVSYVLGVIKTDLKMLGNRDSFTMIDMERKYELELDGHKFEGFIDRLDSFEPGVLRVVDYKTGSDRQDVIDTLSSPQTVVNKVFSDNQKDSHQFKAALQFYIYDRFVAEDSSLSEYTAVKNCMYSMTDIFTTEIRDFPVDNMFNGMMHERIEKMYVEMNDTDRPFLRAPLNSKACSYCDFKVLCARMNNND